MPDKVVSLDARTRAVTVRNFGAPDQSVADAVAAYAVSDEAAALKASADLAASDAGMGRVVEDLISALVSSDVIALADLPAEAQAKISARATLRGQL